MTALPVQPTPTTIAALIKAAHFTAFTHGWWEEERPFLEQIALMHTELSEAVEEYRDHGLNQERFLYHSNSTTAKDKPEGIAVEFADVLIRIFDTCGRYGIPLEEALRQKMDFNQTRPYRHGGKLA